MAIAAHHYGYLETLVKEVDSLGMKEGAEIERAREDLGGDHRIVSLDQRRGQ